MLADFFLLIGEFLEVSQISYYKFHYKKKLGDEKKIFFSS